jgi:hypothetical protein
MRFSSCLSRSTWRRHRLSSGVAARQTGKAREPDQESGARAFEGAGDESVIHEEQDLHACRDGRLP